MEIQYDSGLWYNHRDAIDPGEITVVRNEMIKSIMRAAGCMEGIGEEEAVLLRECECFIHEGSGIKNDDPVIVEHFMRHVKREWIISNPFGILFEKCYRVRRLEAFFRIDLHEQDFVKELVDDRAVDMTLHHVIAHPAVLRMPE